MSRILNDIESEIAAPTPSLRAGRSKLEEIAAMQQRFREHPIGGRLARLKKLVYWFTASAFDRQAKVIEAMLDLLRDAERENRWSGPGTGGRLPHLPGGSASAAEGPPPSTGRSQAHLTAGTPDHLAEAVAVRAEMQMPEKVLLYGLIFAFKPRFCLEIGTFRGGSAAVICAAMDDNGLGRLICVDPDLRLEEENRKRIERRATLIEGGSPAALPRALEAAGERFPFALIDGDHSYRGVLDDAEGVLELLADDAYLLFHDCHFFEVHEAIEELLRQYPRQLVDCGVLSIFENPAEGEGATVDGRPVIWGGLRLLRFRA